MQEIHIGEIRIRFRGVTEQQARASLDGIENDVLALLGRHVSDKRCSKNKVPVTGDIDAGTVECKKGATAGEIRAELAGRIAGIVGGRIR